MNPFVVSIVLMSISSTLAQNLDQFGIGNGINPAQLYPFMGQPPPPMMGPPPPPHGPGPHGPGHVHAPHPEGPHELFRQTPRHGGPGHAGPPSPVGPYATGLRLPAGYQYGLPPQFQLPSPYPNPMGVDQLIASMTTSTVECSCSVSFGIQNATALVLPRSPQSSFPGVVCGPGSVALCRIQCMAQALNASFDLLNQAVNPTSGSGVSLQQFICGNQVNNNTTTSTSETGSTGSENNGRMVNIKSETSCSEQSTDYSSTNRRTEAISLGPQECSTLASIGSFQLPTITSAVPPAPVN